MSNTSRHIRGLLAVAALTAGVSWLAAAPASAGGVSCQGREMVELLETPESVATVCDEAGDLRASATAGRTTVPARGEGPASMERLARIAGLPGLSQASAVVSFADTAGVAAGTGTPALPALPSGMPGFPGHSPAGTLATAPDLPGLPGTPGTDLIRFPVSEVPSVPRLTDPTGALSGDGTALPLPLEEPVSVQAVTEDLPAAIEPEVPVVPVAPPADAAPSKVTSEVTSEVAEETAELPALDQVLPQLGLD
ncbi:hypothetical protein AB0B56_35785 [Streptosporangium canum]|uniref:hypothetical protein n=1 Tax=Streptosporangium canum TaxID=324952 RepID=UPI00344ABCF7